MTKTRGRATVTSAGYVAYIKSPQWQAVRRRYFASKLPKDCASCGKRWGSGDHLHHRTYKNLGSERLMDLVPLCQPCHAEVHRLHAQPKWKRKGLWYATREVIRRNRWKRELPNTRDLVKASSLCGKPKRPLRSSREGHC